LCTTSGDIDLLGKVTGVGRSRTSSVVPWKSSSSAPYHVMDLDVLIAAKRAAGRAKDLEVLAELEAIREERANAC